MITVNSVKCQMQYTEDCSIINMMQELVYVRERDDVAAYFYVFCVHNLDQRVCVSWKCRCVSRLQELALTHSLRAHPCVTLHTVRTSQTLLGLQYAPRPDNQCSQTARTSAQHTVIKDQLADHVGDTTATHKIMPNCSQIGHYRTVDDVSDFALGAFFSASKYGSIPTLHQIL